MDHDSRLSPAGERKPTRTVYVGKVPVGGGNPVSVQSMTKCPAEDIDRTLEQIQAVEQAGCEIIRISINSHNAADALHQIVPAVNIPIVADIHFDHELALKAMEKGVQKIRINPGNIGSEEKIKAVVDCAKFHKVPVRIGVNSGSLEKTILKKYGYPTAMGMVESAIYNIDLLEKFNFHEIIISMKSSNVWMTIEAHRILSEKTDYPVHLGVTEAGSDLQGETRSILGIGTLLAEGIGDTIRVSLTGDPVREVVVGREILRSLELSQFGISYISCPTCGRMEAEVLPIVQKLKEKLVDIKQPMKVAVMGCVVNGPGESRGADVGVCLGSEYSVLYVHGKSKGLIANHDIITQVEQQVYNILQND